MHFDTGSTAQGGGAGISEGLVLECASHACALFFASRAGGGRALPPAEENARLPVAKAGAWLPHSEKRRHIGDLKPRIRRQKEQVNLIADRRAVDCENLPARFDPLSRRARPRRHADNANTPRLLWA